MMNRGIRRRRFLQMASALGLGAELAPWASLRTITPLKGEEAQLKPEMVKFRPEIEPVVRLIEDTPLRCDRTAPRNGDHAAQEGLSYNPPTLWKLFPRGNPQHQAAARRIQVSRRHGH